jgi:hypothetical protein
MDDGQIECLNQHVLRGLPNGMTHVVVCWSVFEVRSLLGLLVAFFSLYACLTISSAIKISLKIIISEAKQEQKETYSYVAIFV